MNITVALLIYKSPTYLDFVMKSLLETHSQKYNVEYLIVCNDATDEVIIKASEYASELTHDYDPKITVVSHRNPNPNEYWLDRVYNAWNRCLRECKTEAICFVNSDMYFYNNWLDELANYDLNKFIPTSRLIESGRMPSLPGLVSQNLGQTLKEFDKDAFNKLAGELTKETGYRPNIGAYMPSLFKTEILKKAGGWRKNINNIPGDKITFGILNRHFGLTHIMVNKSIAYHLQRAESIESGDPQ